MTPHPDAEALAFLAEDLLEPDEERTVAAHIETCSLCAATLDELTGVSEILASVPAPELPRDVADLLDQRIADAARERAGHGTAADASAETGPEVPAGATVTSLAAARRRRAFGLPKLLVAAAAGVFVVGGGTAVVNAVLSAGGGAGEVAAPLEDSEAAPQEGEALPAYVPRLVASGTVYTDDALPEQAAQTLDLAADDDGPDAEHDPDSADGQSVPMDQAVTLEVEQCSVRVEEAYETRVTLVDDAFYGGDAARAWVMFAPGNDQVDVYVVDPRCAQGDDTDQAVLARTAVDAP
ncbi:anti-sigma factor family protein [Nocardiopsis sp. NPDC050513]|uniref:anti-sigma factor family protein n=1 Tax=Nocardiopsis sp. NPDC050513 TaxID=3364338 RepID=UPI0037B483DD